MRKHILIDARLYGPKHTGLGRYTKNILVALKNLSQFSQFQFSLIVYPELLAEIKKDLGDAYSYYPTNIRHYSLQEQLFLPFFIFRLHPQLVHFTHFNKPILYLGRSVVTVHDLIKHFSRGPATTTRHPLIYWPKYLSYILWSSIVIKTNHLIVPSHFWKEYLQNHFHLATAKITVTHEAVDPAFLKLDKTDNFKQKTENYLIYTGNLYPHKNIEVVLEALTKMPQFHLKIVCARSVFTQRIEKLVNVYHLKNQVEFLGYLPDSRLVKIYRRALALIHPSLLEGFSLTGLEAMAVGCPVIASNASCLPEIYGNAALYFDPHQSSQIIQRVNTLMASSALRHQLISQGYIQASKYNWSTTAQKTLDVYHQVLSSDA